MSGGNGAALRHSCQQRWKKWCCSLVSFGQVAYLDISFQSCGVCSYICHGGDHSKWSNFPKSNVQDYSAKTNSMSTCSKKGYVTHTRQEWIIIVIRQELNPVTCKLDEKQINLRCYNPDRHCENGSISWRDGKDHQKDVTTSYATASRCVTTVPFSWRDGKNHQMMWPPAMQQHPGASLRFHFMARWTESPNDVTTSYATASRCITTVPFRGETDRITTCRYKILRPVSPPPNVRSFVGTARTNGAVPRALFKKGEEGRKKKEVLHLSRCYTHMFYTHVSSTYLISDFAWYLEFAWICESGHMCSSSIFCNV